jgi:pro-apoptotic serine protease NMA111
LKPFNEYRKLELSLERELEIRNVALKKTCMLVYETVLSEGPAYGKLQEGDVLLKVNGRFLTSFIRLDEIMDASVNKLIRLLV